MDLEASPHLPVRLVVRTIDRAIGRSAAHLAYYALFSLFPFLLALLSLARHLPVEGVAEALLLRSRAVLPPAGQLALEAQVHELVGQSHPGVVSLGFALALWSSSRAVDALRVGLNRAHGVTDARPWWKREGLALGLTLVLALLLPSAVALISLGGSAAGWVGHQLGLGPQFAAGWAVVRFPLGLLVVFGAATLCYALLPDVKRGFRWFSRGALAATVAWVVATWLFSQYATQAERFSLAYGSIGAVMALLTWLYLSGFIFLVGAELDGLLADDARLPFQA